MSKKIIFFSSTEFGAEVLKKLINENQNISLVVTRTDKVRKRGNKILMTEVKKVALENNIDVLERDKIDDSAIEIFRKLSPDFFIVVAYGTILGEEALSIPKICPLNIHASLLPLLRGASPIESAILEGHHKTGISYMKMCKKLDAGDVYKKFTVDIEENETFDSLNAKLLDITLKTILPILNEIERGLLPEKQEGDTSYAKKFLKDDEIIDFKENGINVKNKINSLSSHIGAAAYLNDERYKLYNASLTGISLNSGEIKSNKNEILIGTGDFAVKISFIQAPGKRKMDVKDFLLGNKLEGFFNEKRV